MTDAQRVRLALMAVLAQALAALRRGRGAWVLLRVRPRNIPAPARRGSGRAPWVRRPVRLVDRLAGPLDEALTLLFSDAPIGMLVIDVNGHIIRANPALARIIGQWADLSPGAPALAMFREADREQVWDALKPMLQSRRAPHDFAASLYAGPDEPGRDAAISVLPLRDGDRTLGGLILRVVDTSVQKRLEMQLSHSQKLQAVGQLAGGIAHDFNNLLTAVIGAADLVVARPGLDAETLDDVRQIRASAERGAALVRQILAFGRQQTLQPRPVAINDAIHDLSSMLRRLLGGQVRLELDLETPGRLVCVDPTQLDQVLVNLAVNARDAMPHGGTLTLRSGHITLFRPLTRGDETIPPGRYVMVEVQDTGTGIPPEVLPRIFEPFFTTKRDRGGSGLGLATVHGIIRQSDGFLAAESELGRGTRLRVYLPRYEGAEAVGIPRVPTRLAPPPPAAVQPEPPAGRTLLLVEDEDPVRRLAERALTQRGWSVLAADSGEAALDVVQRARSLDPGLALAVVVSDLVMPGMDGAALVRHVRQIWPGLPAILVSGYAEETLRRELGQAPMIFLPKPYTLAALTSLASDVTTPQGSAAEPSESAYLQ